MTAPAPLSGGDARTQLAEAFPHADWCHADMDCCGCVCDNYREGIADALLPTVERIADERAAEALERAMREDRTTVEKLHPVERLTCFLVKGEDLLTRAASLRAASRGETGR